MGSQAVDLLPDLIEKPGLAGHVTSIEASLIVRGSTGPAPSDLAV